MAQDRTLRILYLGEGMYIAQEQGSEMLILWDSHTEDEVRLTPGQAETLRQALNCRNK